MPERVLPENLSGEECRLSLLDKISQRLQKDGYLNPTASYNFYEAEITIKARFHDVGRVAEVNITEHVTPIDNLPDAETAEVTEVEGSIVIPQAPPNTVREETGLDMHVQTTESGKPTIKKVRYPRKKS